MFILVCYNFLYEKCIIIELLLSYIFFQLSVGPPAKKQRYVDVPDDETKEEEVAEDNTVGEEDTPKSLKQVQSSKMISLDYSL